MASIQFYKFNSDPREVRKTLPSPTAAVTLHGVTMGFPDGTIRVELDLPIYNYTHFGIIESGSTPTRIYRITSATWINSKAWEIDYVLDGAVTAYYKQAGAYNHDVILTRTTDTGKVHKWEYDPSYPLDSGVTVSTLGTVAVPLYLTIVIMQPTAGVNPSGVYGTRMVSPRVFQADASNGQAVYRAITASTAGADPNAPFIASCITGIYLMPKLYSSVDLTTSSIDIDKYGTTVTISLGTNTVYAITSLQSVYDSFPVTIADFTTAAADFSDCSPITEYCVYVPGAGFYSIDTENEEASSVGVALYPDPISGTVSIFQRVAGSTRFERGGTRTAAVSLPVITSNISTIRLENAMDMASKTAASVTNFSGSFAGATNAVSLIPGIGSIMGTGAEMLVNNLNTNTRVAHAPFNLDGGAISSMWSCNAKCWKIKRAGIMSTSDFWGYYGGVCGERVKLSALTTSQRHWIDARYSDFAIGEVEGLRAIEDLSHGIYPMGS